PRCLHFMRQRLHISLLSVPTRRSSDLCGKCCLHKLEDEDTGDVYYTKVACRYLDHDTSRCQQYVDRQRLVEACAVLTPDTVKDRSEEHTSELQSRENLVCRLLLEKKTA